MDAWNERCPCKRHAHAVLAQPCLVGQLAAGSAEEQRDVQLGVDRFNLRPGAGASQEDGVDSGGFISLDPAQALIQSFAQAAGAAGDHRVGVGATRQCGLHLAHAFFQRYVARAVAELHGQHGILDGEGRHSGRLQLFDRALDAQGVAVAMVGVDHERQRSGAADAVDLLGELAQGQHDVVGGAEHRAAGDGAGEHTDLEAQILGDTGRNRVKHGAGMHANIAGQNGAIPLPSLGVVHKLLAPLVARLRVTGDGVLTSAACILTNSCGGAT